MRHSFSSCVRSAPYTDCNALLMSWPSFIFAMSCPIAFSPFRSARNPTKSLDCA